MVKDTDYTGSCKSRYHTTATAHCCNGSEWIVICAGAIGRVIKVIMEWETFVREQQVMLHQNVFEFNHISGAIPMMLAFSIIEGYVDLL